MFFICASHADEARFHLPDAGFGGQVGGYHENSAHSRIVTNCRCRPWCRSGLRLGVCGGAANGKEGTTPYVTHFIFRPLMSIDIPGLGTATNLGALGTTQNMKGEKMLDNMSARCAALSVASGDKKYI